MTTHADPRPAEHTASVGGSPPELGIISVGSAIRKRDQSMDLHAWFEVYVCGRRYTFEPTQTSLAAGARVHCIRPRRGGLRRLHAIWRPGGPDQYDRPCRAAFWTALVSAAVIIAPIQAHALDNLRISQPE